MTDFIEIVVLLITGVFGGILAGLLGVGGGVIYVVVLTYYLKKYDLDDSQLVKYIVSNSAFSIFFASLSGSIKQYLNKNFFLKETLLSALPAILSSLIISYLILNSNWYSKERFAYFFVSVLLLFFFKILLTKKTGEIEHISWYGYSLTGFITGIFGALSGLGGGIIMVPVLSGFYKLKLKKATSVSLAVMCLFTLSMSVFYMFRVDSRDIISGSIGTIIPSLVIPLSVGVIIGSPIGVMLSTKLPVRIIRVIFALLIILVAFRMAYSMIIK